MDTEQTRKWHGWTAEPQAEPCLRLCIVRKAGKVSTKGPWGAAYSWDRYSVDSMFHYTKHHKTKKKHKFSANFVSKSAISNNVTSTISFKSMVGLEAESYFEVNFSSWTNLDPDQTDPACSLGTRSRWRRQLFRLIRNPQGFEKEQRMRSHITMNPGSLGWNTTRHDKTWWRDDATTRQRDENNAKGRQDLAHRNPPIESSSMSLGHVLWTLYRNDAVSVKAQKLKCFLGAEKSHDMKCRGGVENNKPTNPNANHVKETQ